MEPHELAIAALNQVAQNTSYCDETERNRLNNESVVFTGSAHSKPLTENEDLSTGYGRDHLESIDSKLSSKSQVNRLSTPPATALDIITPLKTYNNESKCQLSHLSHIAAAQEPMDHALVTPLTTGQKRTADGQVKVESPVASVLPPNHQKWRNIRGLGHSSNKTAPRIEELTSELRTRLSYAMIKVNNGWQSNSIDEVESLASQKGSPASSSFALHGRHHFKPSPRAAIASIQGQIGNNSHSTSADFDACCRLYQPCRTYESFWRDHSVTENMNNRQSPSRKIRTSSTSRTLAPPVEIRRVYSPGSSTPKRKNKTQIKPSFGSKSPSTVSGPQTPQRIDTQEITPVNASSQTTVQEQDAIETLIFMSSPGNLSNILPPPKTQMSAQKSPLRSELYMPSKSALGRRIETKTGSSMIDKGRGQIKPAIVTEAEERKTVIECLLEEMGDSSSEDEAVLRYSASQGVTMGQV